MPAGTIAATETPVSKTFLDHLRVSTGVTLPATVGLVAMSAGLLPLAPASLFLFGAGMAGGLGLAALDSWLDDPKRSVTTRKVGKTAMTAAGVASAVALAATVAVTAPGVALAAAGVGAVAAAGYGVSKLFQKFRGEDAAEKAPKPVSSGAVSAALAGALAASVVIAPPVVVPVAGAAAAVALASVKAAADEKSDQATKVQESSAQEECESATSAEADRTSEQERRRRARRFARRMLVNPIIFPFPGSPFLFPITSLPLAHDLYAAGRSFSGIIGDAARAAARDAARTASERTARDAGKDAGEVAVASDTRQEPVQGITETLKDSTK